MNTRKHVQEQIENILHDRFSRKEIINISSVLCGTEESYETLKSILKMNTREQWKKAGEIHIIWSIEDVHGQVESHNDIYDDDQWRLLSDEEAMEVLEIVQKYHDCNYGITWESIDDAIEMFIREDK